MPINSATRVVLIAWALCCTLASAALVPAAPVPATLPTTRPAPEGTGVNIHFTDSKPGEMEMLAASGVKWVRMDFFWADTEKTPGVYDFSAYDRLTAALKRHGMKALFILCYTNPLYDSNLSPHTAAGRAAFAKWAAAAVTHFKGRGYLWEMWNEPNISFWKLKPNVDDYAKLALEVGKALRAAAPEEIFIGPATSTVDLKFLDACFAAGLLEYWSAVSVHPYRQDAPETAQTDYRGLRLLIERYKPTGRSIPILAAEWGYSTAWPKFDDAQQAKYLARQALFNLSQNVPLTIWYDWHDDGPDAAEAEHRFGIVRHEIVPDRTPVYDAKPAYAAARTLTAALKTATFNKRLSTGDDRDWVLLFDDPQSVGLVKLVCWTTASEVREITLPATAGVTWRVTSHLGHALPDVMAAAGKITLRLTDAPAYFAPASADDIFTQAAAWERLAPDDFMRAPGQYVDGRDPNKPVIVPMTRTSRPVTRVVTSPGGFAQTQRVVVTNWLRVLIDPGELWTDVRIESPGEELINARITLLWFDGMRAADKTKVISLANGQEKVALRFHVQSESRTAHLVDARGAFLANSSDRSFSSPAALLSAFTQSVAADGDAGVKSSESAKSTLDLPDNPSRRVVTASVEKAAAGWKFWRLGGTPERTPLPGEPKKFGLWVHGDASGVAARMRLTDAVGRTFQPDGGVIDWKGWKFVTFVLDARTPHWGGPYKGGPADGVVTYPVYVDTLLVIDPGKEWTGKAMVSIAGPMVIEERD